MRFSRKLLPALIMSLAAAAPVSADSLLGDKDCFGTLGACAEGSVVPYTTVTADPSDPAFTDRWMTTSTTQSWTHTFAPTSFGGLLSFRTLGIGDVAGPYEVFADSTVVGQIPYDGGVGHNLVETFTFALSPAIMADGIVTVSFTPTSSDGWAIDYSEITVTAVPEPETYAMMLAGLGLLGFAARRRKQKTA
jgi:hypothetical protein